MLIHSLRPKKLEEIVGQDEIVSQIKKQFDSGRIPNFFILHGNTGSGKTTLARIISLMLQTKDHSGYNPEDIKFDIKEINAADKNGIDDIRLLIETSVYRPFSPSIAKVVIMDEAHQLTTQAQNTLLKLTEDPPSYMYYIFCTTNLTKINSALRRRAYIINTKGIDNKSVMYLLRYANGYNLFSKNDKNIKNWEALNESEKEVFMKKADEIKSVVPLYESLIKYDIDSPGVILQTVEKYINGTEPDECIFNSSNNSIDSHKLCTYLSKGDWSKCTTVLKDLKKEDIVMTKINLVNYLKSILLTSTNHVQIAKAIKEIAASDYTDDLGLFLAHVCIACEIMNKK